MQEDRVLTSTGERKRVGLVEQAFGLDHRAVSQLVTVQWPCTVGIAVLAQLRAIDHKVPHAPATKELAARQHADEMHVRVAVAAQLVEIVALLLEQHAREPVLGGRVGGRVGAGGRSVVGLAPGQRAHFVARQVGVGVVGRGFAANHGRLVVEHERADELAHSLVKVLADAHSHRHLAPALDRRQQSPRLADQLTLLALDVARQVAIVLASYLGRHQALDVASYDLVSSIAKERDGLVRHAKDLSRLVDHDCNHVEHVHVQRKERDLGVRLLAPLATYHKLYITRAHTHTCP